MNKTLILKNVSHTPHLDFPTFKCMSTHVCGHVQHTYTHIHILCSGDPSVIAINEVRVLTEVVQLPSRVYSLQSHGLQHTRPPCPSPSPRVCPSSCPLSHDTIEPSHPLLPSSSAFSLPQHQGLSDESAVHIR